MCRRMFMKVAMLIEQILPVARKRLFTVRAEAPLSQAASMLSEVDGDLLVVCDGGHRLKGVITKTDIVKKIGSCCGSSCREIVAETMNGDVVFCAPGDQLQDIWLVMKERGLKNVPVLGSNAVPLGVVNAGDALEILLSEAEQEDNLLRDYVACSGYR